MDEKIFQVNIDDKNYLFKLSSQEEVMKLRELSSQLERRIKENKKTIVTTDYSKVLILTCLHLLEEISQIKKNKDQQTSINQKNIDFRLNQIKNLLKLPRNDFS